MGALKDRLASAMEAAEMNQPQLSEAASRHGRKVSQQVIQHLLSGRNQTSGLLPEIAAGLGVSLDWLASGKGGGGAKHRREALLVGKVGAGAEIIRFDEGVVLGGIVPPPGLGVCNAAEVAGDSMYPLQEGWIIFYGQEHGGIPEECVGKLSVVQVKDGPTLLKTLKKGSKRGLWRLESWNAAPREDVKVEWAAKVIDIRPR